MQVAKMDTHTQVITTDDTETASRDVMIKQAFQIRAILSEGEAVTKNEIVLTHTNRHCVQV